MKPLDHSIGCWVVGCGVVTRYCRRSIQRVDKLLTLVFDDSRRHIELGDPSMNKAQAVDSTNELGTAVNSGHLEKN